MQSPLTDDLPTAVLKLETMGAILCLQPQQMATPPNQIHSQIFVTLASLQLAPLVSFYSALLATSPTLHTATYAEFQLSGLRLAIFTPKVDHVAEFSAATSGAMSLCLEVGDLVGAIARCENIGHPPSSPTMTTSHGQEIYAYDPDGNRLILHQAASKL